MTNVKAALKLIGKAFLIFLALHSALVFLLWPWYSTWGTTKAEAAMALPGDETKPAGALVTTKGITINATPDRIWPWITQLGQGRGGMYSYTVLENLVGCKIKNIYEILPEEQHLKLGDYMVLHPAGLKLPITAMETNKYMIASEGGWSFHLLPQADGTTRLVTRGRNDYKGFAYVIDRILFEPMAFLMEQKMLRTIRDTAEAQARS